MQKPRTSGDIIYEEKNKESSNSSKIIPAASLFEQKNVRRSPPSLRTVQNFLIVWLDENFDEENNSERQNAIKKLREVVNAVNTFADIDECINFITNIKTEKAFMICSGALGQKTVPIVYDMAQISTIYIFCEYKNQHEQWIQQWPKIKGIFTDIKPICEALKQAVQEYNQNTISMSFVATSDDPTKRNLDELDQSFMYTQILKEILLTINFDQEHIQKFITYYREQFVGNPIELGNIDEFKWKYRQNTPIWWYTSPCFLFSMVNRALRTMEVDLIIKLGFFVRDLHQHITQVHSEQYGGGTHSAIFTVYRGQGLTQTDFDQLVKTEGGLLSFNNFLSTSLDPRVSLAFAESNQDNPDLIGVLFQITIDLSVSLTPFANVHGIGYYQEEEEILFSMHSIFRIVQIKQIDGNNRLWQVELALTGDHDPQLQTLTESIREETSPHEIGWKRLGLLLIQLGKSDKAQQVYDVLLDQTSDDGEKAYIYHHLGMVKDDQGEYADAIIYYENSIKIKQKILSPTDSELAASYIAVGLVYKKMGEYSKSLSSYEKALEICQKTLPANHHHFAASYNNIGEVYVSMGEYSTALSFHEKAHEIKQRILPPNHPDLASSYNNIAVVYDNMVEYSKALSFHEKAREILQKTLPPNHPDLAMSYNNIGGVYMSMREYSKALSSYEKALEILQKTLPPNHHHLAIFYDNLGGVYMSMGEYSKALSSREKALEILQNTLPTNYPDLAISYCNIGKVFNKMGEYSKALSHHEEALRVFQKALPENHYYFAITYNEIGLVYENIREYQKAFSFYERAIEIGQRSLPENHPRVKQWKENLENVKKETADDYVRK